MKLLKFAIVIAGLALFGSGPATTAPAPGKGPSPRPTAVTLDDQFVTIAEQLPGFGGLFFDKDGVLNITMKNADGQASPAALSALKARAVAAITSVLGKDLDQARDARGGYLKTTLQERADETRIVKGDFDAIELVAWRKKAAGALAVKGAVFLDLDEERNRLVVGIERSTPQAQIETLLKTRGVPLNAVIIETTEPIKFLASLRDKRRPVVGGYQIEADVGVFANKTCTLGFNVTRFSVEGFVTNAHCTETRGVSNDTDFAQPDDPVFSSNHIGDEDWDPEFFRGDPCPEGRKCRFSDAAFVAYTLSGNSIADAALIARTTFEDGSRTINNENPTFRIVSETSQPLKRTVLVKVGRTTGWSAGIVTETCQDRNVKDTDITLLCQGRVARIAGTHKMTDQGDSGSPVFQLVGDGEVSLHGILWGGPDDGSAFAFSPMKFVHMELQGLTIFPPPPTPPPTPMQQKGCTQYCDPGRK